MSSRELDDYTWKGDTYWMADEVTECPECGGAVSTNGTVYVCTSDCDWWELIEDYEPSAE